MVNERTLQIRKSGRGRWMDLTQFVRKQNPLVGLGNSAVCLEYDLQVRGRDVRRLLNVFDQWLQAIEARPIWWCMGNCMYQGNCWLKSYSVVAHIGDVLVMKVEFNIDGESRMLKQVWVIGKQGIPK